MLFCFPFHQFVPMLVDICCGVVEERGLLVTGIYRIPGNTAGVTYLQDELNKGIEKVNLQDEVRQKKFGHYLPHFLWLPLLLSSKMSMLLKLLISS